MEQASPNIYGDVDVYCGRKRPPNAAVNVNTFAKCEGKYRQVIYCCYLTVAESAGTPQLILNLKRQFYPWVRSVLTPL